MGRMIPKGPEVPLIYEGKLIRRLISGPVQQTPLCIDEGEGEEVLSLERILGAFEGASIKLTIEASEDAKQQRPDAVEYTLNPRSGGRRY